MYICISPNHTISVKQKAQEEMSGETGSFKKKKKGGGRCPVVWHTGNEEKIQSTINIYDLPVLKDTKIIF